MCLSILKYEIEGRINMVQRREHLFQHIHAYCKLNSYNQISLISTLTMIGTPFLRYVIACLKVRSCERLFVRSIRTCSPYDDTGLCVFVSKKK